MLTRLTGLSSVNLDDGVAIETQFTETPYFTMYFLFLPSLCILYPATTEKFRACFQISV